MSKKPDGLDEFHAILGKLAQVPKKEVEQQENKRKKRATKRKK